MDCREVKLLTRKGLDWTWGFPTIPAALKKLGLSSALLDGEIVVEDAHGHPAFPLLQADLAAGRSDRFRYYLFDLLYCEGFDLTKATLVDRKALLQRLVGAAPPPLPYSEHLAEDGPTTFQHASRPGSDCILSQ